MRLNEVELAKWLHHLLSAAQNLPWEEGDSCADCTEEIKISLMPAVTEITRERDEARAGIAAAIREAVYAVDKCEAHAEDFDGPYFINKASAIHNISAMTPASAIHAEKLLVAQMRLEEAKLAHGNVKHATKVSGCQWCNRIADLTAALEAIEKSDG